MNRSGQLRVDEDGMSFASVSEPLWQVVFEIVSDEGLSLYDIELLSSRALRIFIEREHAVAGETKGQGGVKSEDCTRVCRRLMVYFAAAGEPLGISSEPEIEVSSPGINRHLRLERHFRSAVGERVKVVGAVKNGDGQLHGLSVVGSLRETSPENVVIVDESSGTECSFRYEEISKARVDFRF